MNSKLKKTILCLFATFAVAGSALAAEPGIIVIDTDGSRQEIPFTALDRITFGSSQVTVKTKDAQNSKDYSYSAIDRILIGESTASISDITAEGRIAVWPTITSSIINVSGAAEGTKVSVYNINGTLVASTEVADDTTVIDLAAAHSGVYIVTIGSQSVKILKK